MQYATIAVLCLSCQECITLRLSCLNQCVLIGHDSIMSQVTVGTLVGMQQNKWMLKQDAGFLHSCACWYANTTRKLRCPTQ